MEAAAATEAVFDFEEAVYNGKEKRALVRFTSSFFLPTRKSFLTPDAEDAELATLVVTLAELDAILEEAAEAAGTLFVGDASASGDEATEDES